MDDSEYPCDLFFTILNGIFAERRNINKKLTYEMHYFWLLFSA